MARGHPPAPLPQDTRLLGGVRLVHAVPQLELVRLAAVQGGEAGQEMDELARCRRRRPGGLQLVPAPQGRRAGGRHGGHDVGGARRGVSRVPLARGGRQGAVAGFHGRAQPRVALHGQAVHVGVEGAVGRAGVAVVLRTLGRGLGALREVRADPLDGLWWAARLVLLPRLRRGPLDGPILLGEAAACDRAHTRPCRGCAVTPGPPSPSQRTPSPWGQGGIWVHPPSTEPHHPKAPLGMGDPSQRYHPFPFTQFTERGEKYEKNIKCGSSQLLIISLHRCRDE